MCLLTKAEYRNYEILIKRFVEEFGDEVNMQQAERFWDERQTETWEYFKALADWIHKKIFLYVDPLKLAIAHMIYYNKSHVMELAKMARPK